MHCTKYRRSYSSVATKRADPNKRTECNFIELLISVQGRMFPNKWAGWKNSVWKSTFYLFIEFIDFLNKNFEKLFDE